MCSLHVIRYPRKLQFDHEVFLGCGQARLACPECPEITNCQYLCKRLFGLAKFSQRCSELNQQFEF